MSTPEQPVEFSPEQPINTELALDLQRQFDLSELAIGSLSVYVLSYQSDEIRRNVLTNGVEPQNVTVQAWRQAENAARTSWAQGLFGYQANHWRSRRLNPSNEGIKWLFACSLILAHKKVAEAIGDELPIVVPPQYISNFPDLVTDMNEHFAGH
jgi:hypothetical protein